MKKSLILLLSVLSLNAMAFSVDNQSDFVAKVNATHEVPDPDSNWFIRFFTGSPTNTVTVTVPSQKSKEQALDTKETVNFVIDILKSNGNDTYKTLYLSGAADKHIVIKTADDGSVNAS